MAPNGTAREQSPKSCLARLTSTWWLEVRNHRMETMQCRWPNSHARDGVHHLGTRSRTSNTTRLLKVQSKTVSFSSLMIALTRRERMRTTQEQKSKTSRTRERLAGAHGSATPFPPVSVRPAATSLEAPNVVAKSDVISHTAGPRPRRQPSFLFHAACVLHHQSQGLGPCSRRQGRRRPHLQNSSTPDNKTVADRAQSL